MQKETITARQAICLLIMFLFGSSVVMGVNSQAEQDSWISLLLALVMTIPMVLLYGRIMQLYPQKDLFAIAELLFGKIVGKIITLLITWYALHLCAMVLRNFSEFIKVAAMPETPQLPIMISMLLVTIYLTKCGVELMGKWALFTFPLVMLTVIFTIVLALGHINFTYMQPILNHSIGVLASSSFQIFTFPFAETVLFLCMAGSVKKEDNPYKLYLYAIFAGGVILLLVMLRNLLALGSAMSSAEYFPSFVTARILNVGDFLSRIEGSISMNFILAGITKISVCLLVAAKGTAALFHTQDYKRMLFPVGSLALALCAIVYNDIMEMFNFLPVYGIYVIPFQIIIPLIIWITAEISSRNRTKTS